MELPQSDMLKLPTIPTNVMCGDHSSFNKTELNIKEPSLDNDRSKEMFPVANTYINPTSSCTEKPDQKSASEHTLRLLKGRRRGRSFEAVPRAEDGVPPNRALIQAALGSFRWPPYLLGIWVLVLLLTHLLHCVVSVLDRTLPALRNFCEYFRGWTEREWQGESNHNSKMRTMGLALVTSFLYTFYCALYVAHGICLWCMEPLCAEVEDKQSASEMGDSNVGSYVETGSKTNCIVKQ